ncbi:hypothetical protein AB0J63_03455 [Streptosporangium canum]|uniref:hypothetical protein n=1 Tax=Streptosporangium canum TaxID=324952 RepID=UPI0034368AD8
MIDIVHQINTTQREMGNQAVAAGEGTSVMLRRVYDAPTEAEVRLAPRDDIAAAIALAVQHLAPETSGDR